MAAKPIFDSIAIIGMGLIGSSIARSARAHGLAGKIIGCDENEIALAYARSHGFIDVASSDPRAAVANAKLVILATPLSTFADIAKTIAPALKPGTIVMDTASVKAPAMAALAAHLPPSVQFIPAHPVAGSEQSGVGAGRVDLFRRRRVIVTPAEPLQDSALKAITAFWEGMGARVEGMPAKLHDEIYAYVSHLPHLLAFAARSLFPEELPEAAQKFLRLSHSNPALWAEIFMTNKENVLSGLDRYLDVISHIKTELAEAPENKTGDAAVARASLFPRVAASCLISTVMEAEKGAGFSFARFAGPGFSDFTSPAGAPPDKDIEHISDHHAAMSEALAEYAARLKAMREALAAGDAAELKKLIG